MDDLKAAIVIRIGSHSEKEYIEKVGHQFDGLMIAANLVEVTPGASASLLVKVAGEKKKTAYYFDPMTYAFGSYVDPETGRLRADLDWIKSLQKVKGGKKGQIQRAFKNSYAKLAAVLGPPFSTALSTSSALTPAHFSTRGQQRAVAEAVVRYQRERIKDVFRTDEDFKDYADEVPEPAAIFSPYFYVEPSDVGGWLNANLGLARAAAELEGSLNLHMILCAPMELLADKSFTAFVRGEVPRAGVKGIWLWFSCFDEQTASVAELKSLRDLVSGLSSAGLRVYNLHGGYFSLALSAFGMAGIAHGVGYGEQKDVVPIIGQSTPTVRYYVPPLHGRFGVPNIFRCFNALGISTPEAFWDGVCNCAVCRGVVGKGLDNFSHFGEMHFSTPSSKRQAQTPAAAKLCRFHFLLSRLRERDGLKTMQLEDIRNQLKSAGQEWGHPVSPGDLSYLARWRDSLS